MMVLFVTQKVCMRKREGERRRGGLLREQYLFELCYGSRWVSWYWYRESRQWCNGGGVGGGGFGCVWRENNKVKGRREESKKGEYM